MRAALARHAGTIVVVGIVAFVWVTRDTTTAVQVTATAVAAYIAAVIALSGEHRTLRRWHELEMERADADLDTYDALVMALDADQEWPMRRRDHVRRLVEHRAASRGEVS